ncbi:hypothetical protein ACNOYE_25155 [Nannocystaceae bacterium ST9]
MRRELEFLIGAGFLLGPMIYALTLPSYGFERCEQPASMPASVEPLVTVEPSPAVVEPAPTIAAASEPGFTARPFMFVSGEQVILHVDAPAEWGHGELFEPRGEARHRAGKAVDLERLPGDLAARIGESIDLYGPAGKLCTVAIERLTLVAQYDGWSVDGVFEQAVELDDEGELIGVTATELREGLWKTQSKWLIGELAHDSKCEGATWARDLALPAPTILTESATSTPTTRKRVRALRRSAELAALKSGYETYRAELGEDVSEWEPEWDVIAAEHPARAHAWNDANGQAHVIELRFGTEGFQGCGGYDVQLERVELLEGGEYVESEWAADPIAVFDADLDGRFELLYDTSSEGWARRLASQSPALDQSVEIEADWVCPC